MNDQHVSACELPKGHTGGHKSRWNMLDTCWDATYGLRCTLAKGHDGSHSDGLWAWPTIAETYDPSFSADISHLLRRGPS